MRTFSHLNNSNNHTTIAQLSDLHLTGAVGHDDSYDKCLRCLDAALSYRPDLLLLTGDLVNDGIPVAYDWLFHRLDKSTLPYIALAGNHDVTQEHNAHLPFAERSHSPIVADTRLSDCTRLNIRHADGSAWQLLSLNSTVAGQIHGSLTAAQLAWLHDTLSQHPDPAIIALHHHPLPVGSAWIDAYRLQHADALWQLLSAHPHAKLILCGHVHQVHSLSYAHTTLLTAPAVSRQFMPWVDDFQIDNIGAGFRLLTLSHNTWHSRIVRI